MDKLEYGDLYRFYVSLGVALIAASVGAIWLFLREPFDLVRTVEQIHKLTPIAQQVIAERQQFVASTLRILPLASGFVALVGLALMCVGLWSWRPFQELLNRRRIAETKKIEHDVEDMNDTEIQADGEANVALQIASSSPSFASLVSMESKPLAARVEDYVRTEKELLAALAAALPSSYEMLQQKRIGQFTFDALIRSKTAGGNNYILELKLLLAPASSVRSLEEALNKASLAADWLKMSGYGRQIPLIVGVSSDLKSTLVEDAQNLVSRYDGHPTAFGSALLRLVHRERIESLAARDVENLLDPAKRFFFLGERARHPQ